MYVVGPSSVCKACEAHYSSHGVRPLQALSHTLDGEEGGEGDPAAESLIARAQSLQSTPSQTSLGNAMQYVGSCCVPHLHVYIDCFCTRKRACISPLGPPMSLESDASALRTSCDLTPQHSISFSSVRKRRKSSAHILLVSPPPHSMSFFSSPRRRRNSLAQKLASRQSVVFLARSAASHNWQQHFPWTLFGAVAIDSLMDGVLVGIAIVAGEKAGLMMAIALVWGSVPLFARAQQHVHSQPLPPLLCAPQTPPSLGQSLTLPYSLAYCSLPSFCSNLTLSFSCMSLSASPRAQHCSHSQTMRPLRCAGH